MIKIKVNPEALKRLLTNKRRLRAASLKLAEIIKGHVRNGVDCNGTPFTPLDFNRVDGSSENPLYATGKHLLRSIHPVVGLMSIGVGTNFIGAAIHHKGTAGKGGTRPSITSKSGKKLKIPIYKSAPTIYTRVVKGQTQVVERVNKGYIYKEKVDIHPRPYFAVSDSEIHQVLAEFLK